MADFIFIPLHELTEFLKGYEQVYGKGDTIGIYEFPHDLGCPENLSGTDESPEKKSAEK
jgi:hypothetical protein